MKYEAGSAEEYISKLPEDRKEAMEKLRETIRDNLPTGFEETIAYGMLGYVIPHSIYPPGYHVDPKQPLPFLSIASQKNYIALYHMGIYVFPEILSWFRDNYPKHAKTKLDMAKSCIRFKKIEDIPYGLIAELIRKISPEDYLEKYKDNIRNDHKK